MLTSMLIAVAIWGSDPEIVFSGSGAPLTPIVTRAEKAAVTQSQASSPFQPLIDDESILRCDTVRGQSVSNDGAAPGCQDSCLSWLEHPAVKEFVSGMNPFVNEQFRILPNYYDPFGVQMGTGSYGPQSYRLGWNSYNDLTVLPFSAARGTTGRFSDTEWNSYIKYATVVSPGVVFSGTGYFNARWWEGPGGTSIPGQVDQISTDLELGFFNEGPWSGQIAFHPQIVETYEARLDRNAFNFDGRAIVTYKDSPQWSFVGGVAIWDRVSTFVVPHAGVIWTPNNRWEVRLLYPKTRVSYFLGNWRNGDYWAYGQAEYTAEAYQSYNKGDPASDRIQITDDRLSLGIRCDTGRYSVFAEAGYVFNRQVRFADTTPAFDLDNTVMFRVGGRY